MGDHCHTALSRAASVDVAITPTHGACDHTQVGAHGIQKRLAISDASSLITNQGTIDVLAVAEIVSSGSAESFLTTPQVHATDNAPSRSIKAAELLFQNSGENDAAQSLQEVFSHVRMDGDIRAVERRGSRHDGDGTFHPHHEDVDLMRMFSQPSLIVQRGNLDY